MNGEELKQYIKRSGLSVSEVAEELGTSPQNLNAKFKRKSIKADFLIKIKGIIDKCCPPLPAEMESSVLGSNINGSNSSNVIQSIGGDLESVAALKARVDSLESENAYLRKLVDNLTSK